MLLPFLSKYPGTLSLFHFFTSAHLFAIVCYSWFCLICPSMRITRLPSSPRWEFLSSRREYLETSQFSYLPVYIRICTERVSPLAVPRKKRGNHFGILSGITNVTSWEGYEANKRSKWKGRRRGRVEVSSIATD